MVTEENLSFEEKISSLFQPDPFIPSRYLETMERKSYLAAEKYLMLAVLEDAVVCFQKYLFARTPRERSLFRETEEWLFIEKRSDWPFSYGSICEALGIDPDYLRSGLSRWKEKIAPSNVAGRSRTRAGKGCKRKTYRKSA